ncbi:MAG: hypothetical protein COS89_09175, partial [Deltaproteobacteria bacterium CG07_land_8_20_14_0_80_38_7]
MSTNTINKANSSAPLLDINEDDAALAQSNQTETNNSLDIQSLRESLETKGRLIKLLEQGGYENFSPDLKGQIERSLADLKIIDNLLK